MIISHLFRARIRCSSSERDEMLKLCGVKCDDYSGVRVCQRGFGTRGDRTAPTPYVARLALSLAWTAGVRRGRCEAPLPFDSADGILN